MVVVVVGWNLLCYCFVHSIIFHSICTGFTDFCRRVFIMFQVLRLFRGLRRIQSPTFDLWELYWVKYGQDVLQREGNSLASVFFFFLCVKPRCCATQSRSAMHALSFYDTTPYSPMQNGMLSKFSCQVRVAVSSVSLCPCRVSLKHVPYRSSILGLPFFFVLFSSLVCVTKCCSSFRLSIILSVLGFICLQFVSSFQFFLFRNCSCFLINITSNVV